MKPSAGKLDRIIRILSAVTTRDSVGAQLITWEPYLELWAEKTDNSVRGLGGNRGKSYKSDQKMQRYDTVFRIRYHEGITTANRVQYEGINYEMHLLVEIGIRDGLLLYCVHTDNQANVNQ